MNRLLLVSLLASLLILPSAFADSAADANTAINDIATANATAAGNVPTTAASKNAEDALDAAIRNKAEAEAANAAAKANPQATPQQKTTAQNDENKATKAETDALARADLAKQATDDPSIAERYRKALEERRAARQRLKEAEAQLRRELGALRRGIDLDRVQAVQELLQRIKRVLASATTAPVALVEPRGQGTGLAALTAGNRLKMVLAGTGETIGRIATLTLTNPGDKPVTAKIPPLLLISRSGKSQHYAAPFAQSVSIAPGKSKVVPLEGVCISRSKPPVAKGQSGELIAQDAEGQQATEPKTQGQAEGPAISAAQTAKILKATAAYYQAAEKLEKKGAYKKMPYSQPKKQQEIAVQWGVWSDPEVAKITGEKPAAKADLAKTIYKQAEEQGPVTPAMKKKLETGITDIFTSIQLTSKVAKDLEQADPFVEVDLTGDGAKPAGVINIDNPPPAGGSVVKPDGTMPNPTTGPSGRAPTPRADPEVPAETILADTIGALMNRAGVLQNALSENPELAAKVERWLRAKERMDRLTRERARRADAMRHAERMRDEARKLRTAARNESNAQRKASLEGTANSLDQGATALETGAAVTPEQRQEGRDAEKEFKQAESTVPEYIKTEVDNALKEQANPPPRDAQEKAEIGPDGKIIESPPKR